ncbi:30S ribosomal protein S27ae [Candidatus Woesearchaeota archaeon]|nr:30S ribosomal protein S27ae [Candidatus Woesearchaeota archaeon]
MAKKKVKPKRSVKPHTLYEISGSTIKSKNKSCPKCGKGYCLAKHSNRLTCGKCGYTEFTGKESKPEPKEQKPAEKNPEKK